MAQTNDLDAKVQKMQALLRRAVVLDESEHEFDDVAWHKFIADVKTFLKEAETEARRGEG